MLALSFTLSRYIFYLKILGAEVFGKQGIVGRDLKTSRQWLYSPFHIFNIVIYFFPIKFVLFYCMTH
jgi:hypothetical protein